ncbi:MAG: M28 family peptidase, partial [Holophagales bacterium]|nr:M28 family peptidase [Holophagales bacterium]
RGGTVPPTWQGGLPLAYRLEGGDELMLRLQVEQDARLVETANVLGFLRGESHPEELVILGSHHDAWSFGAGDPNSGTILVFEVARAFAAALREGYRPARTVVFANWGAEEFGIIGSTEWVEARRDELLRSGVAYFNLDGAAMGTRFRSASSPSLKSLIAEVAVDVPQARDEDRSVFDTWAGDGEPAFGNLGGGSDHVGFYCHVGVPSAGLSAGGSRGSSYHSNYEDLHWYRQVVGDDYAGALMLSRMLGRLVARLASAPLLPLDPARYGEDFIHHLEGLAARAAELGIEADLGELAELATAFGDRAAELHGRLLEDIATGRLVGERLERVNAVLLQLARHWLHAPGMPERPWFRNLFAATDPDSGYAPWMLPALRWVVERDQPRRRDELHQLYADAFGRLSAALDEIESALGASEVPATSEAEADPVAETDPASSETGSGEGGEGGDGVAEGEAGGGAEGEGDTGQGPAG